MLRHVAGLAVLVGAVGLAYGADTDKDDLEKLQGKWVLTGYRADGKIKEDKDEKSITFSKDLKMVSLEKGKPPEEGTFKIDASKKPKQIELVEVKDKKKETIKGVYQLKGDVLEIVLFHDPKDADPFSSKDSFVMMFKRAKK